MFDAGSRQKIAAIAIDIVNWLQLNAYQPRWSVSLAEFPVYIFSDLLLVRDDSVRAVTNNHSLCHVCERTR